MGKRHDHFFGCRIVTESQSPKYAAGQSDGQGQPKHLYVATKGLRKGMKEPMKEGQSMRFLSGFMNLPIGPGEEGFQITPHFRLRRKGHDLGQVSGYLLIEVVKLPRFFEVQAVFRLIFQFMEDRFQLGPRPLAFCKKLLQIDNHKSCLCFNATYCEISWEISRSFSKREK